MSKAKKQAYADKQKLAVVAREAASLEPATTTAAAKKPKARKQSRGK